MFVDASAIVAILTEESDGPALTAVLDTSEGLVTSAIAIWESAVRLMSKSTLSEEEAYEKIQQFLISAAIVTVPIGADEAEIAVIAYGRYGKRRHPADLNMGDCFAYACAKTKAVPLLYIGNDFAQTDVNDRFA